ncbi:hypothetical protein [Shewanella sp.]|uniref:hypothetical protein n=1 Tax=Shewanella sp. TaxID=50422 RepID=UPI001EC4EC7D|nr:hypothetical protein [Shewanella sp.]NRB25928.1 hypothetical protein [Shewanella sp.]
MNSSHVKISLLILSITLISLWAFYPEARPTSKLDNQPREIIKTKYTAEESTKKHLGKTDGNGQVDINDATGIIYNSAPLSMLEKGRGEISVDLSAYSKIKIGDVIAIETPHGPYQITLNDYLINDDGTLTYEFLGEDGSDSTIIFNLQTHEAFVRIETDKMSFESFLDSNGVGEFVDRRYLYEQGFRPSEADSIIPTDTN